MAKLESDTSNLSSIEYHEDQVIVFMNDIIDEVYQGLVKFETDVNLEGLRIELEVDKDLIHRIDSLLKRSTELVPENLESLSADKTRQIINYKDLVRNMWFCITCGGQFTQKQIECPLCKQFRPLETYENILHRPERVT